jgi:hypothetical protein
MKKLFALLMVGVVSLGLVACAPDGMSDEFWNDAQLVFDEIDEDTMEMEVSDRDDLQNLKLLKREVESRKEAQVIEAIETMIEYQQEVAHGENEKAFDEYMDARDDYSDIMEVVIYNFEFTEED